MSAEEVIIDEEQIIADEVIPEDEHLEYFYSGNTLNIDESYGVMKSTDTNVIIIAGHIGSGKTTILSAIYEKYQMGNNKLYSFSGSKTLIGFEKCTHYSRLASNGKKPSTRRTHFEDEYKFLHLKLLRNKDMVKKNILISDVSGEQFEKIITSSDECNNHRIISRADHFIYVFDGEKMLEMISRETYISNFLTTIRRLIETNNLLVSTKICILISKSDIIQAADVDVRKEIEVVIDKLIMTKLPRIFKNHSFNINCSWICAQNHSNIDLDDSKIIEIEKILDEWVSYTPKSRIEIKSSRMLTVRMIDNFIYNNEGRQNV